MWTLVIWGLVPHGTQGLVALVPPSGGPTKNWLSPFTLVASFLCLPLPPVKLRCTNRRRRCLSYLPAGGNNNRVFLPLGGNVNNVDNVVNVVTVVMVEWFVPHFLRGTTRTPQPVKLWFFMAFFTAIFGLHSALPLVACSLGCSQATPRLTRPTGVQGNRFGCSWMSPKSQRNPGSFSLLS